MDVPFFSGDERLFFALYERMIELTNRELIEYAQEINDKIQTFNIFVTTTILRFIVSFAFDSFPSGNQ